MKNEILTVIGIFGFLAIAAMMAACNESTPVNGSCEEVDAVEMALDECLDDLQNFNVDVSVKKVENMAIEPVENEYAVTDWQFRAEMCEDKFLQCDGELRMVENQKDGLIDMNDDLIDAIMTLPQETIDYNCGRQIWESWICQMAESAGK